MTRHGRIYQPRQGDAQAPQGQRLDDTMMALLGTAMRPAEVLDPTPRYSSDDLPG